jgi:phytoene synthase
VRIFGADDDGADRYARALGGALQLTNILRDLGPDAAAGRFYLPLEDLERFGVTEDGVVADGPARLDLLGFEAERARRLYADARALVRGRERTMVAAEIMASIYQRLLDQVVRRGFPARGDVVRVPRPVRGWLALRRYIGCRFGKEHAP